MRVVKNVVNLIYSAWVIVTFFGMVFTLAIIYLSIFFLPDRRRTLTAYRANRIMTAIWFFICGIRIREVGKEQIDKNATYVFVANHTNMLDMPVSGYFLQHYCKALAKRELLRIPGLGYLFGATSIMVDRSSPESRRRSMQSIISYLQRGVSIMLFPEGTRNRTGLPLKDFHAGAFRTAIEAQVPILPFVYLHIRDLQPVDSFRVYPGTITIRVLAPIPTTGMVAADSPRLLALVHQRMQEAILEHDYSFKK